MIAKQDRGEVENTTYEKRKPHHLDQVPVDSNKSSSDTMAQQDQGEVEHAAYGKRKPHRHVKREAIHYLDTDTSLLRQKREASTMSIIFSGFYIC